MVRPDLSFIARGVSQLFWFRVSSSGLDAAVKYQRRSTGIVEARGQWRKQVRVGDGTS